MRDSNPQTLPDLSRTSPIKFLSASSLLVPLATRNVEVFFQLNFPLLFYPFIFLVVTAEPTGFFVVRNLHVPFRCPYALLLELMTLPSNDTLHTFYYVVTRNPFSN